MLVAHGRGRPDAGACRLLVVGFHGGGHEVIITRSAPCASDSGFGLGRMRLAIANGGVAVRWYVLCLCSHQRCVTKLLERIATAASADSTSGRSAQSSRRSAGHSGLGGAADLPLAAAACRSRCRWQRRPDASARRRHRSGRASLCLLSNGAQKDGGRRMMSRRRSVRADGESGSDENVARDDVGGDHERCVCGKKHDDVDANDANFLLEEKDAKHTMSSMGCWRGRRMRLQRRSMRMGIRITSRGGAAAVAGGIRFVSVEHLRRWVGNIRRVMNPCPTLARHAPLCQEGIRCDPAEARLPATAPSQLLPPPPRPWTCGHGRALDSQCLAGSFAAKLQGLLKFFESIGEPMRLQA